MLEGFVLGSVVAKTGRCAGRFCLRSVLLPRQVDVLEGFVLGSVVAKTGRCAGRFCNRSVLLPRQVDVLEGFAIGQCCCQDRSMCWKVLP